jgi:hypothetical protein
MSLQRSSPATLGDLLASSRQRRFVGREAELELFGSALATDQPPFSVLHLQGPGGIGKTSLLEVFERSARDRGHVVRLDGRTLVPSPRAVRDALRTSIDVPAGDAPVTAPADRIVLLIDSYEQLAPVDNWLRTQLLPRLPASTLTVLASRDPPGAAWRADPAWRDLLRIVTLRNLGPAESREYLADCGVPPALHAQLLHATHGHPLGLSLVADVVARGGALPSGTLTPDLLGDLVRGFVEVVLDESQRASLGACALARVTTEGLLRDALAIEDAYELFSWLRRLSFVESGPDGVFPHDLARDALDADLRWRDPEGYTRIFRGVAGHIRHRLRSLDGHDQQRAISDLKFLFRNLPSVLSPVDWDSWGQNYPHPAAAEEREAILGLVVGVEGEASADIAAHWWEHQPEGFFVVRDEDDAVRGVIVILDLTAVSDEIRAVDPGARSVWDQAHRRAPPRPGEVVTQTRFVIDRESYQGPSPTINAVPIVTLQRHLATPGLAWDYLTLHEPEPWDDYFALAALHRERDADFLVGGRRYGVFGHDYRQVPVDDLIGLWIERALAQDPQLRVEPPDPPVVLSQEGFDDAVRQALKDLQRPELLARNPLVRTRLLRDRAHPEDPGAAALETLLREAIDTLRQHPRDDRFLRAIECTYVHPAPTQEAAASRLDLPFSTYRRHLTRGIERIVSWLWNQEVYGNQLPRS